MQQNKVLKTILFVILAIVVAAGLFMGGIVFGNQLPTGMVQSAFRGQTATTQPTEVVTDVCTGYASTSTPEELKTLFAPFWESWGWSRGPASSAEAWRNPGERRPS